MDREVACVPPNPFPSSKLNVSCDPSPWHVTKQPLLYPQKSVL